MRITLVLSVLTLSSVATGQWHQATPTNAPAARVEPAMAFDAGANKTVLFGGADISGFNPTYFVETWTWDGLDWTQENPTNSPPGRFFARMCYDSLRGVTVLYGGETSSFIGPNYFDDTWEWDGTNWTQITTVNTPGSLIGNPGVAEHSMAYDVIGQRTVMFGGELFGGFVPSTAVTLEYDGVDWVQTSPALSPPRRAQASMCSAPSLGGVLLFGGTNFNNPPGPGGEVVWNDLWVYNSATDTWTDVTPTTGPVPQARAGASLLYDQHSGLYVMFGGYDSDPVTGTTPINDTWTFDGTVWTDVTATYGTPNAPRVRFESAEGPGGSQVVFGGGAAFFGPYNNETWLQGCVATSGTYGAGCTGSAGIPSLTPANDPAFGANFDLDVANLEASAAFAFMVIGLSNTTSGLGPIPVDLGSFGLGTGCELWASADATTLFPVAGGTGTYSSSTPLIPAFCNLTLYYQAFSIDAGAIGGFAASNGASGTLGY